MEANKALQDAVILIPSLEPDERLPRYVQTLADSGFGHLVIVDDGSGAPSQEIFDRIARMDDRIQVLHHEVNRGKGMALKTGYQWIREHLPEISGVITADADGQHTVKDCIRLAEELEKGKRALYLGSRDFNLPHVPPKSRFGNKCTSVVFRLCHGVWLPDTQTGLRAFRREDLDFMIGVEGERYEYEMNVLIRCAREGLEMIPVPIETVYENDNEGTHFHPIRDSWRIYKVILGSFFRYVGASLFCTALDQGLGFRRGQFPAEQESGLPGEKWSQGRGDPLFCAGAGGHHRFQSAGSGACAARYGRMAGQASGRYSALLCEFLPPAALGLPGDARRK